MGNFLNKLSVGKWLFAISVFVVIYWFSMWNTYSHEADAIRKKSLEHFGGDIMPNLGFFEILKSAHFDFFGILLLSFFLVFIPYLLIAAYFFDYKNEVHAGWRRVYVSAQILIPVLFAIFMNEVSDGFITLFIIFFGVAEISVLILIKFFIWIREGFAAKAE